MEDMGSGRGPAWFSAVRGTQALKEAGLRPLLIARGGAEAHGAQVRLAACDVANRDAVAALLASMDPTHPLAFGASPAMAMQHTTIHTEVRLIIFLLLSILYICRSIRHGAS